MDNEIKKKVDEQDQQRVTIHKDQFGVQLACSVEINGLGEVVSVHLTGCVFQPVEGPHLKEMQENREQLIYTACYQLLENLHLNKVVKVDKQEG